MPKMDLPPKKDHCINVIGSRPTGLGIVQIWTHISPVLAERQHENIDEILALNFSVLDGRKVKMLNHFPTDWMSIARLIDAPGRA